MRASTRRRVPGPKFRLSEGVSTISSPPSSRVIQTLPRRHKIRAHFSDISVSPTLLRACDPPGSRVGSGLLSCERRPSNLNYPPPPSDREISVARLLAPDDRACKTQLPPAWWASSQRSNSPWHLLWLLRSSLYLLNDTTNASASLGQSVCAFL